MAALVQTVLKNTHTEYVVRITGTGTTTITLASLVTGDETYDATRVHVDVRKIWVSAVPTQETKVTRNSVDVLQLFGSANLSDEQIKISDQPSKDITVTTGGDGTVILTLRKSVGYDWPYRADSLTQGA